MSDYPFCKTVEIRRRDNLPNFFPVYDWLEEQGYQLHFDYTYELHYGEPMGDPVAASFIFDDARKAVALKLVWG